jgi:GxxExxY protein
LCYRIANTLGHGFAEKVYENALAFELRRAMVAFVQQQSVEVFYEGEKVGHYKADLIVEATFATDRAVLYLLQKHHRGQGHSSLERC